MLISELFEWSRLLNGWQLSGGLTTHPLSIACFSPTCQCVSWICSQMERWWRTPTLISPPAVNSWNWSSGRGSSVSIICFTWKITMPYLLNCSVLYQCIAEITCLYWKLLLLASKMHASDSCNCLNSGLNFCILFYYTLLRMSQPQMKM